jgi:tRNA modification GTPase
VVEALMATLCAAGARPAGPGEFTARAFAAGRLDLAQAEAVMAVIAASGRRSLAAAQRMLQGQLSAEVNRLADRLRSLLARVELAIDFSEEGEPLVGAAEVARETAALRDSVVALARRSRDVAHLDGDVRVALVGRPNVGKSSLFNRLAGANRAIVTDVAGTTRDELRESFMLAGSRIVLSDTAGLEDALAELNPRTAVSRAAQERTLAALARADLVLVVTESARMRREAGARHDAERLLATLAAPAIVVLNKSDLDPEASQPEMVLSDVRLVTASALTGQGLDELRSAMVETLRLGDVDRTADGPAVSSRHRRCLELASEGLTRALDLCVADRAGDGSLSEDLVAMELRESLDALGGITGRTSPEDVLDEVFSRFCIGK